MRIGIGFNADLPVHDIVEYSLNAEKLGFHSFWMHEHSFGRDAVSYLSCAAQATETIKLGVACLSPYVRHPVALAMTSATLQESSNGRMILGLGTGFPLRLDLLGVNHEKPIAAVKEAIEICKGVWSGDALNYSGKVFSVKNVKSLTGRTSGRIPIYVAGWKKNMLMLTGRYADGYVGKGGESTQSIRQIVTTIDHYAQQKGRSVSQIEIGAYLLTLVDETKEIALERAKKDPFVSYMLSVQDDYLYEGTGIDPALKKPIAENYFKGNLSQASTHIKDEMLEAFTLIGTTDQVSERITDFQKAGLTLPILQPISMKPKDVRAVLSAGGILIGNGIRASSPSN